MFGHAFEEEVGFACPCARKELRWRHQGSAGSQFSVKGRGRVIGNDIVDNVLFLRCFDFVEPHVHLLVLPLQPPTLLHVEMLGGGDKELMNEVRVWRTVVIDHAKDVIESLGAVSRAVLTHARCASFGV